MSPEASPPENVLLIVVDALRTDKVGCYQSAGGESLTPNIDSLASDGEVFEQCYACVNATDSSMTTMLTGLYPTHHGILNHGENVTEEERKHVAATKPLPELVSSSHHTVGVDMLGRWHERGFDEYFMDRSDGSIQRPDQQVGTGTRALRRIVETTPTESLYSAARSTVSALPSHLQSPIRSVYRKCLSSNNPYSTYNRVVNKSHGYLEADWIVDEVTDAIDRIDQQWFVLAHFWDTHLPYHAPPEYKEAVADREYPEDDLTIDELVAPVEGSSWAQTVRRMADEMNCTTGGDITRQYDATIRYVDDAVGQIVSTLKAAGEYENTAIVVTADHGESLTEHDILYDHHGLYDPTVHVPFIVSAPGFEGREDAFVQHTDFVPTVLDLLDLSYEPTAFDGHSLCPESRTAVTDRDAVHMEEANTARKRAIRTAEYKLIKRLDARLSCRYCDITHAEDVELYDLEADPGEMENVVSSNDAVRTRLEAELERFIESVPHPESDAIDFEADPEVIDRLKDMGYK